jgi:hypothetical protein
MLQTSLKKTHILVGGYLCLVACLPIHACETSSEQQEPTHAPNTNKKYIEHLKKEEAEKKKRKLSAAALLKRENVALKKENSALKCALKESDLALKRVADFFFINKKFFDEASYSQIIMKHMENFSRVCIMPSGMLTKNSQE